MEATTETRNAPPALDTLLTPEETAKVLKITVYTLTDWRCRPSNRVPLAFVKVGRLIRYRAKDVSDFIERRTHSNVVDAKKKPRGSAGEVDPESQKKKCLRKDPVRTD